MEKKVLNKKGILIHIILSFIAWDFILSFGFEFLIGIIPNNNYYILIFLSNLIWIIKTILTMLLTYFFNRKNTVDGCDANSVKKICLALFYLGMIINFDFLIACFSINFIITIIMLIFHIWCIYFCNNKFFRYFISDYEDENDRTLIQSLKNNISKNNKNILISLAIIIVVFIIIALLYFTTIGFNNNKRNNIEIKDNKKNNIEDKEKYYIDIKDYNNNDYEINIDENGNVTTKKSFCVDYDCGSYEQQYSIDKEIMEMISKITNKFNLKLEESNLVFYRSSNDGSYKYYTMKYIADTIDKVEYANKEYSLCCLDKINSIQEDNSINDYEKLFYDNVFLKCDEILKYTWDK